MNGIRAAIAQAHCFPQDDFQRTSAYQTRHPPSNIPCASTMETKRNHSVRRFRDGSIHKLLHIRLRSPPPRDAVVKAKKVWAPKSAAGLPFEKLAAKPRKCVAPLHGVLGRSSASTHHTHTPFQAPRDPQRTRVKCSRRLGKSSHGFILGQSRSCAGAERGDWGC